MQKTWRFPGLSGKSAGMKARHLLPALLCLTLPAHSQEWARFLGTNGTATGTAPGLPSVIQDSDYAWKTDLPGTGVSSPVAWENKIFMTAELPESGHRALLCYDLQSGKELWRQEDTFQPHGKHRFNSFASSSPAADKDRVYLAWTSAGTMKAMAVSHAGKKLWETDLGPYSEEHGSGSSPVLAGNRIIVSTDCEKGSGGILAINPDDGSTLWKTPRSSDRTPFSTPLTYEETPGKWRIVVSSNPAALTCFDAADGKVLWQVDNPSPGLRAVGSPAKCGDIIFAAIGQGGTAKASVAVRLKEGSANRVWEGKKAMPYVPTPVALGDHFIFMNDGGILSSVQASDGTVKWSERLFQDQAYSTPVLTGDRIVCVSRSGNVAITEASSSSFKLLGTTQLGEPCDSTPAVAGGRLIIRTAKRLLCIPGAKIQP